MFYGLVPGTYNTVHSNDMNIQARFARNYIVIYTWQFGCRGGMKVLFSHPSYFLFQCTWAVLVHFLLERTPALLYLPRSLLQLK